MQKFAFELAIEAADEAPDVGHEEQWHFDHDAVLGRALRGETRRAIPTCAVDKFHIDILTAHFVQHPDWFDVVVASNLFGDILSDLGPACTGTIGIAPSANLNPDRTFPSLFEPVHGSAPDIAGKGIANPIGQIWSASLMLDWLGHPEASATVLRAIEAVLTTGPTHAPLTRDIGGKGSTEDFGRAIAGAI